MRRSSILLLVLLSCVKQPPVPQSHVVTPLEQFAVYRRIPSLLNCQCSAKGQIWAALELEQRSAVSQLIESVGKRWGHVAAVQCASDFGLDLPENDAVAKVLVRGAFAEISFPGTRLSPIKMILVTGVWKFDYVTDYRPDVDESPCMQVNMNVWIGICRKTAADIAAGHYTSLKQAEAAISTEDERQTA
jgi:hypothetical protein